MLIAATIDKITITTIISIKVKPPWNAEWGFRNAECFNPDINLFVIQALPIADWGMRIAE
jgi:hypothetical protein